MIQRVVGIIKEQLSLDGVDVTMESSFKEDLGADSLDLFELILALEAEFDIEIPTEELDNIKTVADAVGLIRRMGVEE